MVEIKTKAVIVSLPQNIDLETYIDELYKNLNVYQADVFNFEMKVIFHDLVMAGRIVCEVPVVAEAFTQSQLQ